MIRKILNCGFTVLTVISALILSFATLLSAGNAISRYFFSISSPFVEEFCTIIVVIMMYLMQPQLEFKDAQLSIAILNEKLVKFPFFRKLLFRLRGIVTLFLYTMLIRAGISVVKRQIRVGAATPVMHLPYAVMYEIVLAALIVVVIYWLFHFFINDRRNEQL